MGDSGTTAEREQDARFLAFAIWAADRRWGRNADPAAVGRCQRWCWYWLGWTPSTRRNVLLKLLGLL